MSQAPTNPTTPAGKKNSKLPPVAVTKTIDRIRAGMTTVNKKMIPPPIALFEMLVGGWLAQCLYVVAELGIADHLHNGPLTTKKLSENAGCHEDSLYRVLRALASHGVFTEIKDRAFANTSISDALREKHPNSLRAMILFQGGFHWIHWGDLLHCVKTGDTAVEKIRGMHLFEFLEKQPHFSSIFDQAMTNISDLEIDPVLAVYDFKQFYKIVDVGGGHGRLLARILETAPDADGVLFDQDHVVKGAAENLKHFKSRAKIESGSFFDTVPKGGDAYVLKHIIHDWEDSKALQILKNIRAAINKDGRLVLLEMVVPEGNASHMSKLLDVEMLVAVGGRERTEKEYAAFLAQAGFKLTRIVPTITPISVIEAQPI